MRVEEEERSPLPRDLHERHCVINSHSFVELLISDENALMKITPYSSSLYTPLNQVWPQTEKHMAHCVCARVFLCLCRCFFSMSLFPLPVIWEAVCVCVTSLSGLNEFHSFFAGLSSHVSQTCSKSLHCKKKKKDFLQYFLVFQYK